MRYTARNKQAIEQINALMTVAFQRDYFDSTKQQYAMALLSSFLNALVELRGDTVALLADDLASSHL